MLPSSPAGLPASKAQSGGTTDTQGRAGFISASSVIDNAFGYASADVTLTGLNSTPILKSYSEAVTTNNPTIGVYSEIFGVQGYTGAGATTLTLDLFFDTTITPGPSGVQSDTEAQARIAFIRSSTLDFYPDYPTLIYEITLSGSLVDNADLFLLNDGSNLTAASVSALPVPATVWLSGSGLAALSGINLRKS